MKSIIGSMKKSPLCSGVDDLQYSRIKPIACFSQPIFLIPGQIDYNQARPVVDRHHFPQQNNPGFLQRVSKEKSSCVTSFWSSWATPGGRDEIYAFGTGTALQLQSQIPRIPDDQVIRPGMPFTEIHIKITRANTVGS
jgi:hypothetical protein